MLLLYSHFSKKYLQFANFLPLGVGIWYLGVSIGIFFFAGRKCVDLVVIFNKGRDFFRICTKSQNLCLHKIFNTGSTTKVNSREFCVFILDVNCTELQPVLLKSYSFHNFLSRSNFAFVFFFSKKIFFTSKKCLCHVYVYDMALA